MFKKLSLLFVFITLLNVFLVTCSQSTSPDSKSDSICGMLRVVNGEPALQMCCDTGIQTQISNAKYDIINRVVSYDFKINCIGSNEIFSGSITNIERLQNGVTIDYDITINGKKCKYSESTPVDNCGDDDIDDIDVGSEKETEDLINYLENNGDFINTVGSRLITAKELNNLIQIKPNKIKILDIRSANDYEYSGHIKGAQNINVSSLLELVSQIEPSIDQIVIAGYSGITESYVASLCNLAGYNKVYALKWGMSAWNKDFDKITYRLSNDLASTLTNKAFPKASKGSLPKLNTGEKTGEEVFNKRVESQITQIGSAFISANEVYYNIGIYYFVDLLGNSFYQTLGHLPDAASYIQLSDFKLDKYLKTLPTDNTIVLYDDSGHEAAFLVAYLNLLGYDAKAVKQGANTMFIETLKSDSNQDWFSEDEIMNYPYEK